jgi:hypothetical protein
MRKAVGCLAFLAAAGSWPLGPAAAESPARRGQEQTDAAPQPAPLSLMVAERGPRQPWRLSLTNHSQHPVQLVADPRLLWFEVLVPGKRKPQTCQLPDTLFPNRASRKLSVVLFPGDAVVHTFDPRWYCFAESGQWRLVPGAFVTPHFGWAEKHRTVWKKGKRVQVQTKQTEPFVARVIQHAPEGASLLPGDSGDAPEAAGTSIKEVIAPSFALPSSYAAWSSTRLDSDRDDPDAVPFELKLTNGSDAQAERTATVGLTVRNRAKRAQYVYVRRELISFEVMGPRGLVNCDPEPDLRAPDRQAFQYLRPGGKVTITSRLVELCPRGTFAQPGLYLVHARLDANQTGDEYDLEAYVGRIVSKQPVSVRIRTGETPAMRTQRRMLKQGEPEQEPEPSQGEPEH